MAISRWLLTIVLLFPLPAMAETLDPNRVLSKSPGWSPWRPWTPREIKKADFDSGFSNTELGGFLDFQNFCQEKAGLPEDKVSYWFRLTDDLMNQIGTGKLEVGCWIQGKFFPGYSATAIRSSFQTVTCLRVNSPHPDGLVVREEPRRTARVKGILPNGTRVNPGSYPALLMEQPDRNWLYIQSPIQGYVSNGKLGDRGNLVRCI